MESARRFEGGPKQYEPFQCNKFLRLLNQTADDTFVDDTAVFQIKYFR